MSTLHWLLDVTKYMAKDHGVFSFLLRLSWSWMCVAIGRRQGRVARIWSEHMMFLKKGSLFLQRQKESVGFWTNERAFVFRRWSSIGAGGRLGIALTKS